MKNILVSILFLSVVFTVSAEEPKLCTMDYTPVCASVQVQCIKAPCPPINQTFGNKCMMSANKLATYLYDGECGKTELSGSKDSINTGNLSVVGMANPASVNCINKGGSLTILDGKNGQYGMCTFPDGSKCEERAYFTGGCTSVNEQLQSIISKYLSTVRFTEEGYKNYFTNLKSKINSGLNKATGATKKAYIQISNFLKTLGFDK